MSLYGFNTEVARIREATSESLIGQMKLEWWRNVVAWIYEGGDVSQGNPVVDALQALVTTHALSRVHFGELLNWRAEDMVQDIPKDVLPWRRMPKEHQRVYCGWGLKFSTYVMTPVWLR